MLKIKDDNFILYKNVNKIRRDYIIENIYINKIYNNRIFIFIGK